MPVENTHEDYTSMSTRWNKMMDVCADEDTIHDKDKAAYSTGGCYLPTLDRQTQTQYEAYVDRASFVPFTSRIIDGFTGMVMRKPVMLTDTDKAMVAKFVKNVDGKGMSMGLFVSTVLKSYLKYSRCATLVEYPVVDQTMSVAQVEKAGIMPKFAFYDAFSILNWRTRVVNNTEVLSMVVLREEIEEIDAGDEFSTETEYQYRVLDLDVAGFYRQRIFNKENEVIFETFPLKNGAKQRSIPIEIHGGITPTFPDLIGIANLNLHHYRNDADHAHGRHYTALPTPYATGVVPDDPDVADTIGPAEFRYFENPEAKVGMLEFTGKGLNEIRLTKDEIVELIVMLTSRILAPQQVSNETALGASIRSSSETSTLAGQVEMIAEDFSRLFKIAMEWAGLEGDFMVTINKDFIPIQLSGADAMAFLTSWIKGGISFESLFEIYKRGELIPADRDIEDEKKDIEAEQAVRRALEVEMAEKLGKAEETDDDLADESLDNNFK